MDVGAVVWAGLRGFAIGVGLSALWCVVALVIARWPARLDDQVRFNMVLGAVPVVLAAGWPAARVCGVPRAGFVALVGVPVSAAAAYALRRWGSFGLALLGPSVGYTAAAAIVGPLAPSWLRVALLVGLALGCVVAVTLARRVGRAPVSPTMPSTMTW